MVYLRALFVKTLFSTTISLVILSLSQDVEAGTMKIAYKKPIFGKLTTIKERRYKYRPDYIRKSPMNAVASVNTGLSTSASSLVGSTMLTTTSSTTPTLLHSLAPTDWSVWATTTPLPALESNFGTRYNNMDNNKSEAEAAIYMPKPLQYEDATQSQYMDVNALSQRASKVEALLPHIRPVVNNTLEAPQLYHDEQGVHVTDDNVEAPSNTQVESNAETNADIEELFPLPQPELLIAPRPLATRNTHAKAGKNRKTSATTTTTEGSRAIPCTCGIFLASQIKRGSNEQPEGAPVITNELDRTFACNTVGQKQCQTKCLETIVQHLPNSANILCATLNRDCRKERAYLFIKNCRNQWHNTNLAAGREYCCRDGQPYACPMV